MAATTAPTRLQRLADATPPDRDRTVDLLRGLSLVAVALGHWSIAVVRPAADGSLTAGSALTDVAALHPVTWLFQVMPLFFLVGGVANLRSWTSASSRGDGYATWLAGRLRRLVVPTAVAVAIWCLLATLLTTGGAVSPELAVLAARTVTLPLWFLAVYVLVVALAPAMLRLHRRYGLAVPVVLSLAVVAVDVAHRAGVPTIGWANFALVWLTPQQLGFAWADERLGRRRVATALAVGGTAALLTLTVLGPYPVSVVGVPGATASNNSPPTVVLLALTAAQLGVVLLARPRLETLLRRPGVWAGVVLLNLRAQTVYLWHLPAMVVVAGTLVRTGATPDAVPGTAAWWLTRPIWLVQLGLALAVLMPLVGRLEAAALRRRTPHRVDRRRAVVAVAGSAVGFALLATAGVPVPGGGGAGTALAGLGALAVGVAALTGRRVSPAR